MSTSVHSAVPPDPEALATIWGLSCGVAASFHEDLVQSLKPSCRALMVSGYEQDKRFYGLSAADMRDLANQFENPLITPNLLVEVADALVKDGEWLGTDKGPRNRHHRWTCNPEFSPHATLPLSEPTPGGCAQKLEDNHQMNAWLREKLVQSLKPWLCKQMVERKSIDYWHLRHLAESFQNRVISVDVLLSVAESLVQQGYWACVDGTWKSAAPDVDIVAVD